MSSRFQKLTLAFLAAFMICAAQAAELRVGLAADITSLDPHHTNIAPNNNALWHMFEALTAVDADTRLVPGLAESWRAVDPHTLRFTTEKPYAMLPYDLNSVFIISRKHAQAPTEDFNSGKAEIGTGPFKLVAFKRGGLLSRGPGVPAVLDATLVVNR